MKYLIKIICLISILITIGCTTKNNDFKYYPVENDKSLTIEEYYNYGIPREINSVIELKDALVSFRMILIEEPEKLPHYNSKKSQ